MGGHRAASGLLDRSPEAHGDPRTSPARSGEVPEVVHVASTGTSFAGLALAALVAGLSALLAVTTLAEFWPDVARPSSALAVGALVWVVAVWWLAHQAFGLSAVVRRSCGLGAWQWLALLLVHEPLAAATSHEASSAPVAAGWWGELVPVLTGSLGVAMLWSCALVYALLWWRRHARAQAAPGTQK